VFLAHSKQGIVTGLLVAIFLWGANNTSVKVLVGQWPPVWTGASRFLAAGLLLLFITRHTTWFGPARTLTPELRRRLWLRGGLSLAIYLAAFNWAVRFTTVSHVALYLGAAPVWALLLEGFAGQTRAALAQRYAAAALALTGVAVLFWPALRGSSASLPGEVLGLASSFLWTWYGRQCRLFNGQLSGAEITAHTMWRSGVILMPWGLYEIAAHGLPLTPKLLGLQLFCVLGGGVVAFSLWMNALQHWKTSEVYLFNNLIPLSSTLWAWAALNEPLSTTFWIAMLLIVAGVVFGQANWQNLLGKRWVPAD
jgi:O-acetylserine/cysteine efflux transporter